jgi:hypothetical protein
VDGSWGKSAKNKKEHVPCQAVFPSNPSRNFGIAENPTRVFTQNRCESESGFGTGVAIDNITGTMTITTHRKVTELDDKLERWLIGQIKTAQSDLSKASEHDRDSARRRYDCALECWADFLAVRAPLQATQPVTDTDPHG